MRRTINFYFNYSEKGVDLISNYQLQCMQR